MAVAVRDIITGARSEWEGFTPEPHPDSVCLQHLNRYQRTLTSRVVARDRYKLSTIQNILKATWEAAWDGGSTGVTAPEAILWLPGVAHYEVSSDSWDTLHLADWASRPKEYRQVNDNAWPAYSIVGGVIHLQGAMQDWDRYASIDIRYVALPAALTLSGNISLPDSAEPAMVAALAYFLSKRSLNQPGAPNPALLQGDWIGAERAFLEEIGLATSSRSSHTLDVW